jgi:hypothetical protein
MCVQLKLPTCTTVSPPPLKPTRTNALPFVCVQLKLPTHCLADAKICIIGAGKMSTLLVKHLESKGCKWVHDE